MKIKIIKNTRPSSWYRERLHQVFEVLEIDTDNRRYIVHKGRILEAFVDFDDCLEVVEIKCKRTNDNGISKDEIYEATKQGEWGFDIIKDDYGHESGWDKRYFYPIEETNSKTS